eukprot:gene17799-biopygen15237
MYVKLNFTYISIERGSYCQYDSLVIKEVYQNANIQRTYCGYDTPPNYISRGNSVSIKFKSDDARTRKGFLLKYTFLRESPCNKVFSAPSGTLTSPGYPKNYPNNQNCTNVIKADVGGIIELTFVDFLIDKRWLCSWEYLKVIDGSNVKTYCGNEIPPKFVSTTNSVTLNFRTDQFDTDRGYKINYRIIPPPCGGTFTAPSGAIASPNFPRYYPNNQNCTYKIVAPIGMYVRINFTHFSIERGSYCRQDFLVIKEVYQNAKIQRTYCGYDMPPNYISRGNSVSIKFKSDDARTRKGFMLKYTFLRESPCNKVFSAQSGTLTSPGYPKNYPINQNCTNVIKADVGKIIELTFVDFSLGGWSCGWEYLKIIDGSKVEKYCSNLIPATFFSTTNSVTLNFRTDDYGTNRGYKINYKITTDLDCNRVFTAPSGTITSLGYPNSYPNDRYCRRVIKASSGKVVELTFVDFSLEAHLTCYYDYLKIIDGSNMKTYCGSRLPPKFVSKTHLVVLSFKTDGSNVEKGFKIQYRIVS